MSPYNRFIIPTIYSVLFMKDVSDGSGKTKWKSVLLLNHMDRCPELPPNDADVQIAEKWYSVIRIEYAYRYQANDPENIIEITVRLQE